MFKDKSLVYFLSLCMNLSVSLDKIVPFSWGRSGKKVHVSS